MKKVNLYLFWGAILLGFVLRCISLFYYGVFDMDAYIEWGRQTYNDGLHSSFIGVYFPIQYQIFQFCVWFSLKTHIACFVVFKSMNFLFDIGSLYILYLIFKKMGVSIYYLLLYWLHPWFLNLFTLGYIDFQFSFFILLTVYFTFSKSIKNYLLASLFLGCALLMKPQAQIIVLSFFIYAVFLYFKYKDFKPFLLFIFPILLFVSYSVYFYIYSNNILHLTSYYLNVTNRMPCLNGTFLNAWFNVAYFLKKFKDPIYSVSDKIGVLHIQIKYYAILAVLILILVFLRKLLNKKELVFDFITITCFSSIIVPFVMTSAHENHLFIGTILMIPILGKTKSIAIKLSIHVILILQFINLIGYYGIFKRPIQSLHYTNEIAFALSLLAFAAFIIILVYFLRKINVFHSQKEQELIDKQL